MKTRYMVMAVLLICVSSLSASELLVNGGFENGLNGWTWTPTEFSDPGMVVMLRTSDIFGAEDNQVFVVNPGTDGQHINTGYEEGGGLSQVIHLTSGTDYTVSVGAAAMWEISSYDGANSDAGLIRLYIEDELLWQWDVAYIGDREIVRSSYEGHYTPTFSGMHNLRVLFTRSWRNSPASMFHYIDDISVIPEPATMSLLVLGSIALLRRNRK